MENKQKKVYRIDRLKYNKVQISLRLKQLAISFITNKF